MLQSLVSLVTDPGRFLTEIRDDFLKHPSKPTAWL